MNLASINWFKSLDKEVLLSPAETYQRLPMIHTKVTHDSYLFWSQKWTLCNEKDTFSYKWPEEFRQVYIEMNSLLQTKASWRSQKMTKPPPISSEVYSEKGRAKNIRPYTARRNTLIKWYVAILPLHTYNFWLLPNKNGTTTVKWCHLIWSLPY